MNVLVCDELSPKGLEILQSIPGIKVDIKTGLKENELIQTIPNYDAAVVRSSTKFTAPVIEAGKKLKVIARAGMGYDNIDVDAATNKGVVVMNTPGGNAVAAAEHTIALMMALARNIPQAHTTLQGGKWDRKSFIGNELFHKTLGLIGLGNVGRHVAACAQGLKMDVIAHDPFVSEKAAKEMGVTLVSLPDLYKRSDYISLHTILNDSTRHLLSAPAFDQMKKGVRIINCARGGLIDEAALLKALSSGKVAGAALDVFENEPPKKDDPLTHHPDVIVTPHLGASTEEAQEQVVIAVAEQLRAYFMDDIVVNGVNVPNVSREVLVALGSYIDLAQRMGSFLGQLELPSIQEVRIECAGEINRYNTASIVSSALRGLMSKLCSETINFVNAPAVAKQRGIRVVESKVADAGNFLSLVTVSVQSGDQVNVVSGSVFGKDHQRLVRYNDFFVEVVPRGHMLVIQNEDKPGTVGAWASTLGKNKINISQMHLSLANDGHRALSIVNIDTAAPAPVVEELRAGSHIYSVRQVHL